MFDQYMPALYIGLLLFAAVSTIAAVFAGPIAKEMADVEEHSSGHNVAH